MPSEALARVAGGRKLDLDRFLPYRLSVLTNHVSHAIAHRYSVRFGLGVHEWRVMAVLGQNSGLSARELALRTAMDKVQVSRAVTRLVRQKRVQRHPDATDGRITRLCLTSRGHAIYDEVVPMALNLEDAFLAALTPEERVQLDCLVGKLTCQVRLIGAALPLPGRLE
ncbi:MAG TPA: MarR family winged helix-turn-helix transcriptional regulator [Rhizomicrobium sp.]|jgi:DNA-binding MarR family transcriptional regulator